MVSQFTIFEVLLVSQTRRTAAFARILLRQKFRLGKFVGHELVDIENDCLREDKIADDTKLAVSLARSSPRARTVTPEVANPRIIFEGHSVIHHDLVLTDEDRALAEHLTRHEIIAVDELKHGIRFSAKWSFVGVIAFSNFELQIKPKLHPLAKIPHSPKCSTSSAMCTI